MMVFLLYLCRLIADKRIEQEASRRYLLLQEMHLTHSGHGLS